jgi:hypothetical protein
MAETPDSGSFTMYGARSAIAGGLFHIEEHVTGIERAVVESPGLAFDLARTVIESACKTILSERDVPFSSADDLPKLFRTATSNLPVLPVSASAETEIGKSLRQTLNGLHTALQGVCELRNACGFASHGAGGPRPAMETVQALLAAGTADAIVGFLYRVHRQDRAPTGDKVVSYEENEKFNDYVDDAHEQVQIFEEIFDPSRILFDLAPEAYRLYLAEYSPENDVGEETVEAAEGSGQPP